MTLISPGIYSIGKMQTGGFTQNEMSALQTVSTAATSILSFDKLYFKESILYSSHFKGKRNSSICSFLESGEKKYGVIQKFILSPPLALIKPFKQTSSSLLSRAGNPCRETLQCYANADLLSTFIVEVYHELCAIPLSSLCNKCVIISFPDSIRSFVINIPNNYEHH